MPPVPTQRKRRYAVDLVDLHSLCETNYVRLLRVFPDYEASNERGFIAGDAKVRIDVTERSRYTTTFRLLKLGPLAAPFGAVTVDLRAYHDARMAEVIGFQRHRLVRGRYQYPNDYMYSRDEQAQQNRFVAEMLSFCLAEGRTAEVALPEGLE
ncbi:histidine kinase [Luminiphilus syltensis NOR5-1B]|uniref:Histidine kinase n=1 Tax=Luminiphilus syltensis NOR5-1B TaxID=565045 RepID=B8KUM0_9GAMM|nr:DUF1249 domain-containing protein [Luminiphilus syltensis]EED34800.1 histidine kinase [Luminiphilus syltensis NOR5-1B]